SSATAPAIGAARIRIGEDTSPLQRATAIHPSPQVMDRAGAMRPPVARANPTPTTPTTTSITALINCQPLNLVTPVVPSSAAVLAIVATNTQPKYSPNVPSVTNLSVGRVEILVGNNMM